MVSVDAWLVPPDRGEEAVSMMSAPASTLFKSVMKARPVVQWVCTSTGRSTASLMALTRS